MDNLNPTTGVPQSYDSDIHSSKGVAQEVHTQKKGWGSTFFAQLSEIWKALSNFSIKDFFRNVINLTSQKKSDSTTNKTDSIFKRCVHASATSTTELKGTSKIQSLSKKEQYIENFTFIKDNQDKFEQLKEQLKKGIENDKTVEEQEKAILNDPALEAKINNAKGSSKAPTENLVDMKRRNLTLDEETGKYKFFINGSNTQSEDVLGLLAGALNTPELVKNRQKQFDLMAIEIALSFITNKSQKDIEAEINGPNEREITFNSTKLRAAKEAFERYEAAEIEHTFKIYSDVKENN